MKVSVLYRPESEHGRTMESFIREFGSRYPQITVEGMHIDSREGDNLARLYDIVQYPAIIVTRDDGYLQKMWQGDEIPLMDEVAAYARG